MTLKTENLAIILTDIVGFTERTAHQSRRENERLLEKHNEILFPIIKKFKGKLIKTIGDALLVIFHSPTDAMLCSMGMQDALYAYNRSQPEEKQIHIRIAASLGEVRVVKGDIFGEPVNTTSRIEGITPADEIYLSEAIYMAMNKAEVPCKEVGWRELKGISEPIRIFNIPRFSTPRLIPEDEMESEDIGDLVFPFGGAHLVHTPKGEGHFHLPELIEERPLLGGGAIALVVLLAAALGFIFYGNGEQTTPQGVAETRVAEKAPAPAAEVAAEEQQVAEETEAGAEGEAGAEAVAQQAPQEAAAAAEKPLVKPQAAAAPAPAPEPAPAPAPTPAAEPKPAPAPKPAVTASIAPAKVTAPAPSKPVVKSAPPPSEVKPPAPSVPPKPAAKKEEPEYKTFSVAKAAYNSHELSKAEYKEVVQELKVKQKEELVAVKEEYNETITELKQQYRDGELDKAEYKNKVRAAKERYESEVRRVKLKYK